MNYLPQCIIAGSMEQSELPVLKDRLQANKTTIYVCENRVCKLPVYKVNEAIKSIENN
jgi:uncharacterized protein YyaL (SSP411 family)